MRLMRGIVMATALAAVLVRTAAAETVRLTFVHVNDVYEMLPGKDGGGLAELKGAVDAERAKAAHLIVTFGGDLLSPSLASSVTKGAHMVGLMGGVGIDVAVLGNHEFDFGAETLRRRMAESRFPWLVGNVQEADGRPFGNGVASLRRDVGGVSVGFVGVLTEASGRLSAGAGEARFLPAVDTAKRLAAELRQQGAEVVVALTHLDLEDDRRLAREARGTIDLILGGHDHDPYALLEGGALTLKAGANAEFLAVAELEVAHAGGTVTVRPVGWRLTSTRGAPADATLAAEVQRWQAGLSDELNRRLAVVKGRLDSTHAAVRAGESTFGNMVADALRAALGADVALINGGGLRGNRLYEDGHELTLGDLRREMPFDNVALLLDVSGAELQAALENGVSAAPQPAGRFPQVSGLRFTYAPSRPPGQRIHSVTVAGKPLDPTARYRLATTDFLADGGDGYTMLKAARRLISREAAVLAVTLIAGRLADGGTAMAVVEGRSGVE